MTELKPLTVKGTLYWVERDRLNKFSNKYQIVLGNLSEEAVAAFEERGIVPANKGNDQGYFITCKSNNPIHIQDADGQPIPDDVLIGNGSKAICVVSYYDWSVGEGRSPSLVRCKVTELVKYESDIDEEEAL